MFKKLTKKINTRNLNKSIQCVMNMVKLDWSDPIVVEECIKTIDKLVARHGVDIWFYYHEASCVINEIYKEDNVEMLKSITQRYDFDLTDYKGVNAHFYMRSLEMLDVFYKTGSVLTIGSIHDVFANMSEEDKPSVVELVKKHNGLVTNYMLECSLNLLWIYRSVKDSPHYLWIVELINSGCVLDCKEFDYDCEINLNHLRELVELGLDISNFVDSFKFISLLSYICNEDIILEGVCWFIEMYEVDIHQAYVDDDSSVHTIMSKSLCSGYSNLVSHVNDLGVKLLPTDLLHYNVNLNHVLDHFGKSVITPEMLNYTRGLVNFGTVLHILRDRDVEFMVPTQQLHHWYMDFYEILEEDTLQILNALTANELQAFIKVLNEYDDSDCKERTNLLLDHAEKLLHSMVESRSAKR